MKYADAVALCQRENLDVLRLSGPEMSELVHDVLSQPQIERIIASASVAYEVATGAHVRSITVDGRIIPLELAADAPEAEQDFGWALDKLRHGHRVCREGWNGKGMWLELQYPDESSKMTLPYIFMSTADSHLVPWLASQTDVLAFDWELAVQRPIEYPVDPAEDARYALERI